MHPCQQLVQPFGDTKPFTDMAMKLQDNTAILQVLQ
jgi:hypothetical protein